MKTQWLLWVGLTVVACGGRSRLGFFEADETTGGRGTGGTSATTSTSATTTGVGAGGSTPACDGLEVGLEPTLYDWPDSDFEHAVRPHLTPLSDGSLALTAARVPVESPGPVPAGISHVQLNPWGDALGTSLPLRVADVGGQSFATAPGEGGLAYSLVLKLGFPGPQNDPMVVVPSLDVFEGGAPVPPGVPLPAGPARPEWLTRWPGGPLLVHWEILPAGDVAFLGLGVIEDGEVAITAPSESGCALFGVQARTVPSGSEGAIVAMTSGREAAACFNDDGVPGPPTRWHSGRIDRAALTTVIAEDVEAPEPITTLELVERSDGAWIVWQTDGSTSLTPPAVLAQRLDAQGAAVGEAFAIVPDGYLPPFGVTRFGDGLAVAYFDLIDPGPPTLVVRIFDDGQQLLTETSTSLPFGPLLGPIGPQSVPPALPMAVSPAGNALLVGWSHGGGPEPIQTGLVRFDCLP